MAIQGVNGLPTELSISDIDVLPGEYTVEVVSSGGSSPPVLCLLQVGGPQAILPPQEVFSIMVETPGPAVSATVPSDTVPVVSSNGMFGRPLCSPGTLAALEKVLEEMQSCVGTQVSPRTAPTLERTFPIPAHSSRVGVPVKRPCEFFSPLGKRPRLEDEVYSSSPTTLTSPHDRSFDFDDPLRAGRRQSGPYYQPFFGVDRVELD